jgi:hypothetical protein
MMRNAMHNLPLIMCKTSYDVEVFKIALFVMNEIMTDSNHADEKRGSNCCPNITHERILYI